MSRPPLTPEQIATIQHDLLRVLDRIERSRRSSGTAPQPTDLDVSSIGHLSRIEALQNQGLMQTLQERERVRVAQVVDALTRIEQGGFGICGACGQPIPFERLQIFPETRTCAACVA